MMSAIWQFIKKYEFFVLVAIWLGLLVAYEITEDATFTRIMGLVAIVAITRLAVHPMWKKDEQAEKE